MKKIILSVILILALLTSLIACNNDDKSVYDTLNDLTKESYSKIQLDITTVTEGIELKANYTLTASKVDYSVEQLSLLPTDGDLGNVSEEYKTTVKGTATIENGKVTSFNNEEVNLPQYDELKGHFDFKESYFTNIKDEDGRFSADVTSNTGFLGTDKALNDVKVVVEYNNDALKTIKVIYETATSTVTSVYSFEK